MSKIKLSAIFDVAEQLESKATLPQHIAQYQCFEQDYAGAHTFLYAYKDNRDTFNAYRREVERLLHWSFLVDISLHPTPPNGGRNRLV